MIPNQWYVILESKQVKERPVGVTRLGEKLVLWRDRTGRLGCLRDECAHRGVQLSRGKVIGDRLQCPFHGFEYDTSGQIKLIPANGKNSPIPKGFRCQAYPTHEAHGLIWIWWGEKPPEPIEPPQFFEDIDGSFSYATVYDPWQAHYSRVIENQLDVMHLPFIHSNTIGRGGRSLVDGPGMMWTGADRFKLYVYNRIDDGSPPLKPSQVPVPDPHKDFWLEFIYPNLWQNRLGANSRIVAAFVPVDDGHTLLYLRFYQRFVRLPALGKLVCWLAMPMNIYIAHQDRRVVNTHRGASGLRIGEKLVQGDRPVIEYRRHREELIAAANVERVQT